MESAILTHMQRYNATRYQINQIACKIETMSFDWQYLDSLPDGWEDLRWARIPSLMAIWSLKRCLGRLQRIQAGLVVSQPTWGELIFWGE